MNVLHLLALRDFKACSPPLIRAAEQKDKPRIS
jgi:hypothetical protein